MKKLLDQLQELRDKLGKQQGQVYEGVNNDVDLVRIHDMIKPINNILYNMNITTYRPTEYIEGVTVFRNRVKSKDLDSVGYFKDVTVYLVNWYFRYNSMTIDFNMSSNYRLDEDHNPQQVSSEPPRDKIDTFRIRIPTDSILAKVTEIKYDMIADSTSEGNEWKSSISADGLKAIMLNSLDYIFNQSLEEWYSEEKLLENMSFNLPTGTLYSPEMLKAIAEVMNIARLNFTELRDLSHTCFGPDKDFNVTMHSINKMSITSYRSGNIMTIDTDCPAGSLVSPIQLLEDMVVPDRISLPSRYYLENRSNYVYDESGELVLYTNILSDYVKLLTDKLIQEDAWCDINRF